MPKSFEAFVAEHGPAIWRGGAKLRGQWFHGGSPCAQATPTLLGGQGCSPECEELFQEVLLGAAHRARSLGWGFPRSRARPGTPFCQGAR